MAVKDITEKEFKSLVSGGKPVLVDFWAPWCSYCRRIAPAYEQLAESFSDRVAFTKVNIDEEPHLSQAEQIEVIPTLVLYKDGNAVDTMVGPESGAMIEEFLLGNL